MASHYLNINDIFTNDAVDADDELLIKAFHPLRLNRVILCLITFSVNAVLKNYRRFNETCKALTCGIFLSIHYVLSISLFAFSVFS